MKSANLRSEGGGGGGYIANSRINSKRSDEIGPKSDKKHAKREAKACLKHKYYWLHREEGIIFIGMKDVYNIQNNQDKVTMKHSYHIIFNPDLDKGFFAMRHIPCACNGCVENISKPWLPNLDKTLQSRYFIETETCKYSSILRGHKDCYIAKIDFF